MKKQYKVEVGEYMNRPVLTISDENNRRIVSFGETKARAILESVDSIDSIKRFVDQVDALRFWLCDSNDEKNS